MKSSARLILSLKDEINLVIDPLMPEDGKVSLLDFPDYSNVGDSAIWLGEMAYLYAKPSVKVQYTCTLHNWSMEEFDKVAPTGTILLNGGGNFGDIWPYQQKLREEVIERYTDRPIIQMPQSLHFADALNLRRAAAIINKHPKFTLLVRDKASFDLAKSAFTCNIMMCPDMAFFLGLQTVNTRAEQDLLLLMRTDQEGIDHQSVSLPSDVKVADWIDEDKNTRRDARRRVIAGLPLMGLRAFDYYARRERMYHMLAKMRVQRGLRQLSQAKYVITDRLHAHILCILLDITHSSIDNNYGKLSGFRKAWTDEHDKSLAAESLSVALEQYQSAIVQVK